MSQFGLAGTGRTFYDRRPAARSRRKEILTTRVSSYAIKLLESVDQQLQGLQDHAERDIGSRPLEAVNQAISYKNVSLLCERNVERLTDIDIAFSASYYRFCRPVGCQ